MAGKRNINRLRKALEKQNTAKTIQKTASTVRKTAQRTAAKTAAQRGASAAQSVGKKYGASGGSSRRSGSQGSYIKNSRLRSNQKNGNRQNDQKKERTTTKAVMQRYNRSAANKAQFRKELRENKNRNFLSDAQKKTLRKNKKEYDNSFIGNLGKLTTGNLRQIAGGHIKTFGTSVANTEGNFAPASAGSVATGLIDPKWRERVTDAQKKSQKAAGEKISKFASRQMEKGQSEIEDATKNMDSTEKWIADVYGGGIGIATDMLAGPLAPAAMFSRAYGSAYDTAEKEGADRLQASLYALGSGGLEMATEKIGNVAKPLRALYGKGVGDDVIDTLIGKITAKATSRAGKNAAYHGGKTLAAAITEGLEEMVSEGLEPTIANAIYAEAVGTPHSTSAKDVLYAGSIGGALGGILGGAGQVVEYGQGSRVQNIFGDDGIKKLAKAAKEVDEAGDAAKGAAINELVDQGEGIAAGQARELYNAVYNQEIKDLERANIVSRSADAIMQRENLISPIQVNRETGEVSLGSMTSQAFDEQKAAAQGVIDELATETDFQMPEMTVDQITSAVAAIQTGTAGIDEVNLFTIGNPEARTIYTRVTGKELPDTNKATREMLYEEIGKNRVASARAETENVVDEIKGLITQDAAMQYEPAGQEAIAQAFSDVNVGNVAQVAESLETFDDFYRAGRNDIAYADVVSVANPVHANVTEEVRRAAWQAGQQDMVYAANIATEQQARVDEAARRNGSRGLKMTRRGRFLSEISAESRANVTASQQAAFRALARVFGIDIHLVDSLESGANGEYHDGAMYLSMESDRALEYVFAHEITHHMQNYAPEEYNQLKDLVRTRWAQRGDMEDAIKTKMAQYARREVKISHEEALDEIIADSTYEMLQDEEFIDEVVKTDRSIAQAILDAIKNVLRKLRLTIAGGDRFTPAQNEALLSELDLLKEFERLWVDGLARAAENRDAVGSMGSEVRQQAAQGLKPFSITRSKILENMKKVAEMSPVVELDGSGFKKKEGRSFSQAVMDYYGGKEFYVNNPTLGDVKVGKRGIKAGTQHKLYGSKIEGFKALREVIEDGYVINVSQDYKNDGTDRVILAAPIEIDGKTYYMGAVVNRTKSNNIQNYYIHDVVLEEKNNIPKDTDTDKRHGRVDVVSPYNILQQLNNINNLSEKDVISDEGRFSLPDTDSNGLVDNVDLSKYRTIGIRALAPDEQYNVGDELRESYDWDFESDVSTYSTDDPRGLGGTSAYDTQIDTQWDEKDEIVEKLNSAVKDSRARYEGDSVLVGGDLLEYGNDDREVVISNPTVIAKYNENTGTWQHSPADKTPTDGPGIRFSLKDTVEETKDLIAQHNLGADNLKKAFGLGGFPMPSIAITKGDVGHANFGEISLIFDKATIDPADNRNKVYGADAWTPTFPDIEYEINDKKASKIYAKANKAGHVPFLNPTDFHPSNMESRISNKGEQGLIEYYKDDYGLKQMYLVDIGEMPVGYVQTTVREEMSDIERREGQWYLDNEPELCESLAKARVDENPMKWRKDNIEKLRGAYKNYLVSEGLAEDAADEVANAATAYEVSKPLLNAEKIKNGKDVIERTENDFTATEKMIDKKINEEDYEKWFSELFSGIEKNSGVWNGKDPYTPSGNRRSFVATHYPVTLDNIVSAMLAQADSVRNADSMFVGTKTIRAAATESFGSIEGIKAASGKLQNIDTEEYESLKESLDSRLSAVMSEIVSESGNSDNAFIDMDYLGYAIEEACSKPTADNIKKVLVKNGWHITDTQAREINNIINKVVDMPVNMFEAKPLRSVGFDEVRAAVVPDDIDSDIKSGLSERGVEVFEYENGNDADRIEKVNVAAEEKDVKFSLPDEADVIDYANEHETEFVDVPPVRDYEKDAVRIRQQTYGELFEQVEKLKRDRKRTKGRVLDERSVREEVNTVISTLMTYSESYTPNGRKRKTNHVLVRDGVHAVSQIFTALKKGDSYEAITTAELAAQDIVERLELVNDDMFYEYKDLRNYLKNTRIVISEEDAANIPDFKDFKKQQARRIRIVKQNGIPVDVAYQELVEQYPELFDAELTHPADQLTEIAEVRESLEPYDIMLSAEETQQLVKQTAQDLLDIAGRGKPYRSTVDKYDEKLRLVKARQKETIRDVRRNERERAERLVQAEREKRVEQVNRAKERADERVQAEKDKAKEKEAKRKDAQARREAMASIEQNRKWLQDRIAKPTDDKHVPEGMKSALADLLSQIDMQTQRSKSLETKRGERAKRWVEMDELRSRLAEIAKEDGSGEFEYDGYIFEVIDSMAQHMDGKAIDEASTEQLHELDILMKYIVANVRNYNKAFDESIKENISEMGNESISRARSRQERLKDDKYHDRSGVLGAADRLLNESMVSPRDFFERLGGGLEKTFMAMRRGMDKHVDNIAHTRDFFDDIFKPYRNKTAVRKRSKPGSAIEKWRDDSQVQTFDVQGGKISLSPAQIMSLYCLSKREQALGHIFGSGIVASRVDKASKLKKALGGKISTSGSTVMVSMEDVAKIIDTLTPEQIEMADKLQGYLNNECAAWGNEVSMRMYGYRKFTEKNYFPIKSADAYLDSNFEGRQATERIKNFGFTKGTVVNANNPIMIDDIFSVVADHVNKMSLYNAFAAPISDFMRVYNYKSRDDAGLIHGSVKAAVEDAYGKKAINYINNFMSDLNSQVQTRSEGLTRFVSKSLANYKKAAIGGNLRVAVQQPTAVMRAFTLISPRYFVNAHINPVKNMKDMQEHCQVAKWKAWGFNQVDMARDIDDIMMNNEWSKIDAVTMEIYGALDNVTWSSIWAAVREETKAKHKDVKVDSDEFYQICNERASEIFDKTQVVDSVFHRSQAMRNTDVMSKMLTSFMSEPTRTYNMMRTEYARAVELWHEGNKTAAIGKLNRATSVFVLNAAAVSAAAAIADALRDKAPGDDDDDSWWANFLANFWGNVNPLNMIPMVKDIWGYTDGWGTSNMAMEGWEKLVQGAMNLAANRDAESLKAFCEGLGYVTGLPVKNVMREVDSIFKALGVDAFAAEEGGEEEKEKAGILDSLFGRMHIKNGGNFDKVLNHFGFNLTEEEKAQREYDERVAGIEEKLEGLSGDEKQEKIWSEATENYTKYIEAGDYGKLDEMRKLLGDLGGDVDKFDESVFSRTKTAYKKNIGADGDPDKIGAYRYYLEKQGMTEAQISREVIVDSDSAKEFQLALCMNDEEAAVENLQALRDAGITYEDAYVLFINRTKAIKGKDFSTGELSYPAEGEISSGFGYRNAPTAGASTYHEGIDIAAPMGSDVLAADGGKVSKVGWNGGKGYSVTINHGNGRYTEYNHLNCYYIQKGDAVAKGQVIAAVGSTGVSTGPHLDFRVRESGTYIDPMIYFN